MTYFHRLSMTLESSPGKFLSREPSLILSDIRNVERVNAHAITYQPQAQSFGTRRFGELSKSVDIRGSSGVSTLICKALSRIRWLSPNLV